MTAEFATLAATSLALAAYLLLVAIALRLSAQSHALLLLVGGAVLVCAASLTLVLVWTSWPVLLWHFLAFYCGGVAIVIFLYGAALKSLSLQMCALLGSHATRSVGELADAVIRTEFEKRIALLEGSGLVERQENLFAVTEKGSTAANRIVRTRNALRLESKGLYAM